MTAFAHIALVYTVVMVVVHLVSAWILRRRSVSERALLRFEAAYYVLLVIYTAMAPTRGLVVAVAVLAAIHLAVWTVYEVRRPVLALEHGRTLLAVQVFDWGEAVALIWILWMLWRSS